MKQKFKIGPYYKGFATAHNVFAKAERILLVGFGIMALLFFTNMSEKMSNVLLEWTLIKRNNMIVGIKELGRAGNVLVKNKSMTRRSLEKTAVLLASGLSICVAIGLIMDVVTTLKKK